MNSVMVQIDRANPAPVWSQISDQYAQAIRAGQLAPGSALPSVRGLSGRLGISPVTVAAAYRALCETGLAVALPRSGFRVVGARNAVERRAAPQRFALHRIEPDLRIHPVAEIARLIGETVSGDAGAGGYEDYRGDPALREAIADLDREIGIVSDPVSGMLMTSGAQQALSLIGRSLERGSTVAVEDPCYPGARLAFSTGGASLFAVPVDAAGPAEAAVQALAEPGRIAAFYCCPTYANPTGRSWSVAARRQVLKAAQTGGFLVIEDDYLGDLDAVADAPPRLAALAAEYPGARVVRLHTFSKTLLPALRLASVTGDAEIIRRLVQLKTIDDLGCSAFLQRALLAFLRQGRYPRHLAHIRPHYAAVRAALAAAGSTMKHVRFASPPSGFCALGLLDGAIDTQRFMAECASRGVLVTPGSDYWVDSEAGRRYFRIGFSSLAPDEVAPAMEIIDAAALASLHMHGDRSLL